MRELTGLEVSQVSGGTHTDNTVDRCDQPHANEQRARDKAMTFRPGSKQRQKFNDKADRFHDEFVKCQGEEAA